MKYQAPKAIVDHPAVKECVSGEAGGFDYKHDVWLKDGYRFMSGRMTMCQGARFHTVKDFRETKIQKIEA